MIYSLAPSERIDTGKTWPVYTIRLRALGRRACICPRAHVLKYSACNIKGTAWSQAITHYTCIYTYIIPDCVQRETCESEGSPIPTHSPTTPGERGRGKGSSWQPSQ